MATVYCPKCHAENEVESTNKDGKDDVVRFKISLQGKKCSACGELISSLMNMDPKYYELYRMDFGRVSASAIRSKYLQARVVGMVARAAQKEDPKIKVQKVIKHQLALCGPQETEFLRLGKYLEWKCALDGAAVTWIQGPRKKFDRAYEKTHGDYKADWSKNKDWVRGTLAAKTQTELDVSVQKIRFITMPEFGMCRVKDEYADPKILAKNPCGYSGYNIAVLVLGGHALPGEIQANTYAMMYGKMDKELFMDALKQTPSDYRDWHHKLGIPGGLGHALYEIADRYHKKDGPKTAESLLAAQVGRKYNEICRSDGSATTLAKSEINRHLRAFGKFLRESIVAQSLRFPKPDSKTGEMGLTMLELWLEAEGPMPELVVHPSSTPERKRPWWKRSFGRK